MTPSKSASASAANQVPVFILAGGKGTRLSEETHSKPKPMVEVGDAPILLHIMRSYYSYGFNDFVILAGYRAWDIKQFFLNYEFRMNHLAIDHRVAQDSRPTIVGRSTAQEKWRVRVIDTGEDTMTGGRVARAFDQIEGTEGFENFAVTYGDGVCDVNLEEELAFHLSHGKLGTVLGVPPLARFGELDIQSGDQVNGFREKPAPMKGQSTGLINGGFFFFKRGFRKYLSIDESCILERDPVSKLASDGGLQVYRHFGFWHPMDVLRDKNYLSELWASGKAPWAVRK